jgi:hypothetical protein
MSESIWIYKKADNMKGGLNQIKLWNKIKIRIRICPYMCSRAGQVGERVGRILASESGWADICRPLLIYSPYWSVSTNMN